MEKVTKTGFSSSAPLSSNNPSKSTHGDINSAEWFDNFHKQTHRVLFPCSYYFNVHIITPSSPVVSPILWGHYKEQTPVEINSCRLFCAAVSGRKWRISSALTQITCRQWELPRPDLEFREGDFFLISHKPLFSKTNAVSEVDKADRDNADLLPKHNKNAQRTSASIKHIYLTFTGKLHQTVRGFIADQILRLPSIHFMNR